MNQEALERLVIDRDSDELNSDAAELLQAWLDRDPASKAAAATISETIALARVVLRDQNASSARNVIPWRRWIPQAAAMAACLAAGVGLTLLFAGRAPVQRITRQTYPDDHSHFWALRYSPSAREAPPPERVLEWTSPVKKPHWRIQS